MKRSGIWVILRKELARFFGDKRLAFTTILLPGLLILVLYSFMGSALSSQFTVDESFSPRIEAVALPDSIAGFAGAAGLTIEPAASLEAGRSAVAAKELDVLLVFPPQFDTLVAQYDVSTGAAAPAAEVYYNSADTDSLAAYDLIAALLDQYEESISNRFDVNPDGQGYDLAETTDSFGLFMASMLPMLLMLFLFSGCMSVAPESIAGEKERGTIATLLITPLRRSHLALGKICALSIIALLSGASSTVGTLLAMPRLMQLDPDAAFSYGVRDYLALTAVILSSVLLIVTVISIISAFAKSIKEAQGYITPLMIVVMLTGVTAMFGGGAQENTWYYLIPFYNSVQTMAGISAFATNGLHLAVTTAVNLCLTAAGVFALTRMFGSERMMFRS